MADERPPRHCARKYEPPHWPLASVGAVVGGILGGILGEIVGAVSASGSTPILTVPCILLGGASLGIAAWGKRREAVVEPEPEDPGEPLDTCAHIGTDDFEAVPVEVQIDEDGDAEPDVVAWLCSQCGAKVSKPRPTYGGQGAQSDLDALEADALKVLLRDHVEQLGLISDSWESEGRDFILSQDQMNDYKRRVNEIDEIKRLIEKRDRGITTYYQTNAPTGVDVGDMWFDVADGNALYRWTGATWQAVEATEVYSHASALPTRRILS